MYVRKVFDGWTKVNGDVEVRPALEMYEPDTVKL